MITRRLFEDYLPFIAGEFGIVYRARLTRSTVRKTESEIVAVKTIKGENMISHGVHCCPQLLVVYLSYLCHSFINPRHESLIHNAQRGLQYLVCVSVSQHLTFHVFIRATNNTNLLGGG